MSMPKPQIVLIENSRDDAKAIAAILDNHYDILPNVGTRDLAKLISAITKSCDVKIDVKERKSARTYVANFITQHQGTVQCYIVDYELKIDDNNRNCDGVSFCENFEGEMGKVPVLFFTKTSIHSEILRVKSYMESHLGISDYTFKTTGWEEDPEFKKKLVALIEKVIGNFENENLKSPL